MYESSFRMDFRSVASRAPSVGDGNLVELDLSYNELTGTIPSELGDLAHVQVLRLDGNQLTGTIPSELGDLAHLRSLHLNGNRLTGCIPVGLRDVRVIVSGRLPFCSE